MQNNESMEVNPDQKYEFLSKFEALPKAIKTHFTCYAIASDW
jgi:hypothetical protein